MKIEVQDLMRLLMSELDLDEGEIGTESAAEDVENWDSLAQLRLCMALEAKFGVTIPLERVPELSSVPAIRSFLADQ